MNRDELENSVEYLAAKPIIEEEERHTVQLDNPVIYPIK